MIMRLGVQHRFLLRVLLKVNLNNVIYFPNNESMNLTTSVDKLGEVLLS